jgi:hypothetical protein
VPSAVFWSVTGLFTFNVTVGEPDEYEPPTMETFAVVAVSETRWKSGVADGSADVACGKSDPVDTV